MASETRCILIGEGATLRLGSAVGEMLRGGECVALSGQLGAGKTTFVKGVATGLGVPPGEPVVSPTFVLVREYAGRLHMYHIDAYRLSGVDEVATIGLDEMLNDAAGVTLVEWAERIEAALPSRLWRVRFEHIDFDRRAISLAAPDDPRQALVERAVAAIMRN
ncbi:MAG: tRNA (adenosine(37)-N6)-threonylcarbamoyltransferase complex ATPase subunit type 1 TsaE [Phycisphaerales bacterium]|nr:tRNA (adenosine(37)-N6)-threonylcarbamoyltransferase complex ATPase subunit type 1 TsaE [Phycisphaerales bacterium]